MSDTVRGFENMTDQVPPGWGKREIDQVIERPRSWPMNRWPLYRWFPPRTVTVTVTMWVKPDEAVMVQAMHLRFSHPRVW